jgi:hypothetical protein
MFCAVEPVEYKTAGLPFLVILEYSHLHARGITSPDLAGNLNFGVAEIVGVNKSTHKTNHNSGRSHAVRRTKNLVLGEGAIWAEHDDATGEYLNDCEG